jgi:hypothetical protein
MMEPVAASALPRKPPLARVVAFWLLLELLSVELVILDPSANADPVMTAINIKAATDV